MLQTGTDKDVVVGIGDDAAINRPHEKASICVSSARICFWRTGMFCRCKTWGLGKKVCTVNISKSYGEAMGTRLTAVKVLLKCGFAQGGWGMAGTVLPAACRFGKKVWRNVNRQRYDQERCMAFNRNHYRRKCQEGEHARRDAWRLQATIFGCQGDVGMAAAALWTAVWNGVCCRMMCLPNANKATPTRAKEVGQELALLPFARAAQDVSDGLAQDLRHIPDRFRRGAQYETWSRFAAVFINIGKCFAPAQWLSYTLAERDSELVFTAPEKVAATACSRRRTVRRRK